MIGLSTQHIVNMASAQQPNQPAQPPLEPQHCNCEFSSRHQLSITPQCCLALRKFINSVVSSPNGKVDKAVYEDVEKLMGSAESLRSLAIANRRNHEASEQLRRQELFMQQHSRAHASEVPLSHSSRSSSCSTSQVI